MKSIEIKYTFHKNDDQDNIIKYKLNRAIVGDGAYDIHLQDDIIIKPFETLKINTRLILELPKNIHAEFRPRSSIASKGLIIHNCLIDSNYRGVLWVVVSNFTDKTFEFKKGERINSLKLNNISYNDCINFILVDENEINKDTLRKGRGFGSTNERK